MKVTVVIPCFNAERFLERCLTSIFRQTHRDIEVIAVDDGSTDGTLALLRAASERSPFPFTLITQPNAGACAARNAGLDRSSGAYIQFMDADDALEPTKIEAHVALAQQEGLPEIIVGSVRTFRADGSLKEVDVQRPGARDPWLDLMRHKLGGTPGNLWLRSSLLTVHGWDATMRSSQEYDLMFRLLQHGARLAFHPEVLTVVYEQRGSVSSAQLDGTWTRFVELRARIIAHLGTTDPRKDLRPHHQVLFDSLRTLYAHAPAAAVELHHRHMPSDFVPGISPATGRGYLLLHRIFGFERANRLRQLLSGGANRR